jgi:RNA polymerase sigma-70 factor (ECF subfamily)
MTDTPQSDPPCNVTPPRETSDEELMQAVQQGDLSAFEQIVLRHQAAVWSVACRFLSDPAEAEDVAQEAFLRVLNAAPRYRPTAKFKTYLLQIAGRLCLDRLRKKRPIYTDDPPEQSSGEKSPDRALMERERRQLVRQAMDELPPQQRLALVLRYDEALKYEEIADVLQISVKAVERLLGRGRGNLAVRLNESLKNDFAGEGVFRSWVV